MFGEAYDSRFGSKSKATRLEYNEDSVHTPSRGYKAYSGNKSTQIGSSTPKKVDLYRVVDAKKTIDEVIQNLTQRRQLTESALREVRTVNSEILDQFRKSIHSVCEPKRLREDFNLSNSTANLHPLVSEFRVHADHFEENEVLKLRSLLNDEMNKNNYMIRRLREVQEENRVLRQNNVSFGPNQTESLLLQNQRLKAQLQNSLKLPRQIFEEIQNLKNQNNELRRDTIQLLRKQKYA